VLEVKVSCTGKHPLFIQHVPHLSERYHVHLLGVEGWLGLEDIKGRNADKGGMVIHIQLGIDRGKFDEMGNISRCKSGRSISPEGAQGLDIVRLSGGGRREGGFLRLVSGKERKDNRG
jgi:hypothetical protein